MDNVKFYKDFSTEDRAKIVKINKLCKEYRKYIMDGKVFDLIDKNKSIFISLAQKYTDFRHCSDIIVQGHSVSFIHNTIEDVIADSSILDSRMFCNYFRNIRRDFCNASRYISFRYDDNYKRIYALKDDSCDNASEWKQLIELLDTFADTNTTSLTLYSNLIDAFLKEILDDSKIDINGDDFLKFTEEYFYYSDGEGRWIDPKTLKIKVVEYD